MLTCTIVYSQTLFSVDYASQAEVKVFVVDYPSQADLKVFKVDYASQAKGNEGLWYFVEHESLLSLVRDLEVEELKNENHFFGDRIRYQFQLATESLFNEMLLLLLLVNYILHNHLF